MKKTLALLSILLLFVPSSLAEEKIVADKAHDQTAANPEGTGLDPSIAYRIKPTKKLVLDLSGLTKEKLKELADSDAIHISHSKAGAFYGKFDSTKKTIEFSEASLSAKGRPATFPGFTPGTHVLAIGKLTPDAFTPPFVALVTVAP